MDIAYAATHLAAYHKTAMTLEHGTSMHDDILAWHTTLAAIGILATLDAYTIITYIKGGIYNQSILA